MPTYSEIELSFNSDVLEDEVVTIYAYTVIDGMISSIYTFYEGTFKATRSTAGEVTVGTPTGNVGETSATNYDTAINLDVSDIVTSRTVNVLTVQSEIENIRFYGARIYFSDDDPANLTNTITNYIPPPDVTNVDAVLLRSPYYINTPFTYDTTTKVDISLYIWDGDLGTVPSTVTRQISRIRPTVDYLEFNTNISNVIRSLLVPTPAITTSSVSQIVDSNADNLKWVKFTASYTDSVETIEDIVSTVVAFDGYGYYSEGVNPNKPSNKVLTNVTYRFVASDGVILLPFVNDGTITSIDVDSDGGEVNATHTITSSAESTDYIQYVCIDCSQITTDTIITVDLGTPSIVYEIVDECRYNPKTIIFKNKYGAFDTVTMFKKSTTGLEVKKDRFTNNYISSGSYTTTKHQYHDINFKAKETVTLNSGYIDEDENPLYKELLLSDQVYFWESSALVPVNVTSKKLDYQTRVNDQLVKYTVEFDYSYDIIQSV